MGPAGVSPLQRSGRRKWRPFVIFSRRLWFLFYRAWSSGSVRMIFLVPSLFVRTVGPSKSRRQPSVAGLWNDSKTSPKSSLGCWRGPPSSNRDRSRLLTLPACRQLTRAGLKTDRLRRTPADCSFAILRFSQLQLVLKILRFPTTVCCPLIIWKLMNFQHLVKFKEGTYFFKIKPSVLVRTVVRLGPIQNWS